MRILGVDPGLRATGYGVIEVDEGRDYAAKLLETGTIEPQESAPLPERISRIYKNLGEIIQQYSPQVMVLEKLYSHYRHPTTACLLGHVRGVICLLTAEKDIEFVEHSVKRIRKSLLGRGDATKIQTQSAVAHILDIDFEKLTPDASDALALALGYAHMRRVNLQGSLGQ